MKNKKIIFGIALIVMAIVQVYAQQYTDEKEFVVRRIDGGKGVEITDYVGDGRIVNIPLQIQKMPVTRIGDMAFYGSDVFNILIPDSVTSIGESAFEGCERLYILIIGNKLTSIGDRAFYGCTSLKDVDIPNGVTSIGKSAFEGCERLTLLTIGNKLTSIGYSAFYGCTSLKSVTIPNSVTTIEEAAFGENQLTSITIPSNVLLKSNKFWCFSKGFDNCYEQNKKAGGTYIKDANNNWRKEK